MKIPVIHEGLFKTWKSQKSQMKMDDNGWWSHLFLLKIFENGDFSLLCLITRFPKGCIGIRLPQHSHPKSRGRLFHENVDEILVDRNLCGTEWLQKCWMKMMKTWPKNGDCNMKMKWKWWVSTGCWKQPIVIYFGQTQVPQSPLPCFAEQLCRLRLCSNQTRLVTIPIDVHLILIWYPNMYSRIRSNLPKHVLNSPKSPTA